MSTKSTRHYTKMELIKLCQAAEGILTNITFDDRIRKFPDIQYQLTMAQGKVGLVGMNILNTKRNRKVHDKSEN